MKAIGRGLLGLLLVALALTLAPAGSPLPPNPHQPLNETSACAGCHTIIEGTLAPHLFVIPIPEKCWVCHSKERLGRSHPIGIDPSHSGVDIEVPEEFPLEDGKVSCGSCHNPHMAFLSETRSYLAQGAEFVQKEGQVEIPWYKTLFLRKSDPIKGFEPLCTGCHRNL
jgi:hypothetical protein